MDTIGSVVGISIAPFVLLLLVPDLNTHQALLKILLGFAAGGLLGDAFLHLIPHALSHSHVEHENNAHGHSHSLFEGNTRVFLCVIFGILSFLCIDKLLRLLRSKHSHFHAAPAAEVRSKKQKSAKSGDAKAATHNAPNKSKVKSIPAMNTSGYLNLAADFTHNLTDGIAIAGSFLISRNVGYVTTLTVLVHELPHEIGDYAILVKSGCGVYSAMMLQLVTALGALLGASLSLVAAGVGVDVTVVGLDRSTVLLSPAFITTCLLPFTAGGFIYIALVSVMPDLLSEHASEGKSKVLSRRLGQATAELAAIVLGVGLMAAIGLFE
ncbi:unnamed protein product [Mesocestoides corti]|nr:unnamed protein product [Mesocestoides corti]